jgi:hypothetical protein
MEPLSGKDRIRLLDADCRVVLPYRTHIRVLVGAADVLHEELKPSRIGSRPAESAREMISWAQVRLQDAASPVMEEFIFFHDFTIVVLVFIVRFVR